MAKKNILKDTGIPEIAGSLGLLALVMNDKNKKKAKSLETTRYTYKTPFEFPSLSIFRGGSLLDKGLVDEGMDAFLKQNNADLFKNLASDMERGLRNDFGLNCKVTKAMRSARVLRFIIECPNDEIRKKILKMRGDFEIAADSNDVELTVHGKYVYLDIAGDYDTVREGDLLGSDEYKNAKGTPLVIGQTVDGQTFIDNLEKLPHLLVAGTTGSGKSVLLHALIISILMKKTPEEVELYMIDPKITEFQPYGRLGYCHTVGDAGQAVDLLRKLCDEMDERYAKFATAGVVDLNGYNAKMTNKLPRKVVVIDELADLMTSVWKKTVEMYISRLSAKARACGIHLIIATQYPTVKVITGQIKANITARIALNVATKTNSMVILDRVGAEKLQKHGDLLYMNNGDPIRMQAPMVDREEIETLVDELAKNQIDKKKVKHTKKHNPFLIITAAILGLMILYKKGNDLAIRLQTEALANRTGYSVHSMEMAIRRGNDLEKTVEYADKMNAQEERWAEEQEDYKQRQIQFEKEMEEYKAESKRIIEERETREKTTADKFDKELEDRINEETEYLNKPKNTESELDGLMEYMFTPDENFYEEGIEQMNQESEPTTASTEATTVSYKTSSDEIRVNPVQPVVDGSGFNEIKVGEQYLGDTYFNIDNRGYRMNGFDEFYYVNEH